MASAVASQVEKYIADNAAAVFSKSYCPYCKAAKQLLTQVGCQPFILELDNVEDGAQIQAYLTEKTGQKTVPNVFIKQQHIGGNSELQTMGTSKVKAMLA